MVRRSSSVTPQPGGAGGSRTMDVPGWSAGPTVIQRIPSYPKSLRTSKPRVAGTSAKWGAKMVMVAVQKKSDSIDLGGMLRSDLTLIASQGYPTEIFEVTPEIVEHQDRFAKLISHRVPFSEVERAFDLALTPGAAEKVIVTFDDSP